MSIDLTGIGNRNEYYTNHYFSTMFEDGASERIKQWTEESKNQETKTPWAMLRENAKQYYPIHDRYDRGQPHLTTASNIISMAAQYLESMGYGTVNSVTINVDDEFEVPVFHEEVKSNKAPMLWAVLAYSRDKDSGIMENSILDFNAVNNDVLTLTDDNIETLATKLLFHTAEPPRFLIVIGIDTIVLIDRNKWNEKRYLEFDLQEIFSRHETTTLQAMSVLLHKGSLCPADGNALIDTLDEQSRKHASGVSQDLKYALRESIEILGNEVIYDLKNRQGKNLIEEPVDAAQLTLECLRYMYRMLFVLFIEARPELGYAPINEQVYASGYSLESLRDIAESIRNDTEEVGEGFYLYQTLSKLYELIYTGYPQKESVYNKVKSLESVHNIFVIPPLKAHIFDPEYTPMLVNAKIRNSVMLRIIDLMSLTKSTGKKGSRRGRISYANLGINQMGAVYEALLSYRGFIAEQDLYEVKKAGDSFNELDVGYFVTAEELDQYTEDERVRYESGEKKGQLRVHPKGEFIYRLAGREREKSASYYTPESLTQCLVKYALKELLKDKTADEILNLTVCEPAMGSAAFLNEAINQLAEAYLDRKQAELGETISHETRMDELQKVKMYIADNNVYGIDLNPVAVELAEVSLWLNTIYKGGYVPWFGTQLVNGNSLIGARRQVYHKSQLTATSKGLRWYENAPERIPFVKLDASGRNIARSRYQVYHFLTGDPGMCDYTDKVIKSLEPEKLKAMKDWNKRFTASYTEDDFKSLIELSKLVDVLWREQIDARHELEAATITALDVYGHKDTRPDTMRSIREKDKLLRETYKSEHAQNAGSYARLKFAMDYWCALWFWPISQAELLPSRSEFLFEMDLILRGTMQTSNQEKQLSFLANDDEDEVLIQDVDLDQLCELFPRLALVRKIANDNKFMHWELEFADVFADKGGFDLVIGNPPWVKIEWKVANIASEFNPLIAIRKNGEDEFIDSFYDRNLDVALNEYVNLSGQLAYMLSMANYADLRQQQGNIYKCFIINALYYLNEHGAYGLIHPEGLYDNPYGEELRKKLYRHLLYHFEFINEKYLFHDIAHTKRFSINIAAKDETDSFITITNLFDSKTIDDCFSDENKYPLMGLKDDNNEWNIYGNPERIIKVDSDVLSVFGKVFDGKESMGARMPEVHAGVCVRLFEKMAKTETIIGGQRGFFCSQLMNETAAVKKGLIELNSTFPFSMADEVYSGPNIWLANPFFKAARFPCIEKSDYDLTDLSIINNGRSLSRTKYKPTSKCYNELPQLESGIRYDEPYKIFARRRLNLSMERTLISTIVPKNTIQIHAVLGIYVSDLRELVCIAACLNTVVYDFYIKTYGKEDLYDNTISKLPIPITANMNPAIARVLALNAIGPEFMELWKKVWNENLQNEQWTKNDKRLPRDFFDTSETWNPSYIATNDYMRRQLFVELDVYIAMILGLTLSDLISIYRLQFPVMRQYESDTWYDSTGKIVFTNNKGLNNVGFDRKEWEGNVKGAMDGMVFTREIEDDTMPGGPVKRTIEYVAPFDKCDREQDYETAWKFFEEKYGKE